MGRSPSGLSSPLVIRSDPIRLGIQFVQGLRRDLVVFLQRRCEKVAATYRSRLDPDREEQLQESVNLSVLVQRIQHSNKRSLPIRRVRRLQELKAILTELRLR